MGIGGGDLSDPRGCAAFSHPGGGCLDPGKRNTGQSRVGDCVGGADRHRHIPGVCGDLRSGHGLFSPGAPGDLPDPGGDPDSAYDRYGSDPDHLHGVWRGA